MIDYTGIINITYFMKYVIFFTLTLFSVYSARIYSKTNVLSINDILFCFPSKLWLLRGIQEKRQGESKVPQNLSKDYSAQKS